MSGRLVLSPRLALAIGIVAVSSGSIFIRFAQADAPSLSIAAFRLSLAVLFLLPLAFGRHYRELRNIAGREWLWLLASGFFLAVHFATWISSLAYTSVASSVALVSTSPLWVALIAWIAWREPVTPAIWLGLTLALCGTIVISLAEARTAISTRPFLGNALALAGALAVSGYWLIGRRLRRSLSLIPYVTLVYGAAALFLIAAALLPQLLGHSSFNWALGHLPASYVAIATLGEPIGAAFLALLFLGEVPSTLKVAAAALILLGILLALRREPVPDGKPGG
jgi:drug/metabolite transporter (DMT)-like permease